MLKPMVTTAVVACGALAVAGCGETGAARSTPYSGPRLTEVPCLERAGFRIAADPSDIAFFVHDRRAGKAEKPGGTFLHKLRVVVEEWQSVPDSAQAAPRWALWTAQPIAPGRPASPEQVVAHRGGGYYVAFVRRPHPRQLAAAARCLKRVQGTRG